MSTLARFAGLIDRTNDIVGRWISWLTLFMVLVQFALVIMRYVFGVGSILVQESLIYAHGTLFMIAAGYTLLMDGHVRVDVFYRAAPPRRKAMVDLCGVLFLLLPVCILLWWTSFPYVIESWKVLEGSRETSGIPGVFLLKSVIPAFVVLIGLQGISLAIKALLVLTGQAPARPTTADDERSV